MDQLHQTESQLEAHLGHADAPEKEHTADRAADQRANKSTSRAMVQHELEDESEGEAEGEEGELEDEEMVGIAEEGVAGPGGELPHREQIEQSFGKDMSGVQAHVGGAAGDAAAEMGAEAYATGNDVAFQSAPDVHTAAHEATHVVQQEAGVQLLGGVGKAGDVHEQEADHVADLVAAGKSAAPVLAKYQPAQHAPAVQHRKPKTGGKKGGKKGKTGGKAAPKKEPKLLSPSEAFEHIKEGEDGAELMSQAKNELAAIYQVMVAQANVKKVHDEAKAAYDQAKKNRAKALEKSDLVKVLDAITTIIELGTSVAGVVKAVKAISSSAKSMKVAFDAYQAFGGAHPAGKIAKDIGGAVGEAGLKDGWDAAKELFTPAEPIDPETMLPDAIAAGVDAGNKALDALTESQVNFSLTTTAGKYRKGALDVGQMGRGVALLGLEDKVLPEVTIKRMDSLAVECEVLQREITSMLSKLNAIWNAYMAGGAEALADPRERGLFEKIHELDAGKRGSMKVAMDQEVKQVHFEDGGIDSNWGTMYSTHRYKEKYEQGAEGVLYITDPALASELKPLLISSGFDPWDGAAEEKVDDELKGAEKFRLSISMCKALMSNGIAATYVDQTVGFYYKGTLGGRAVHRHKGEWYDKWWLTPEFDAYWNGALGRRHAFVQPGTDDRVKIPGATKQEVDDSTHVPQPMMPY